MSSFKKTNTISFAKASAYINTDTLYWKQYEFPITVKEFSTIDFIDASTAEPHYIAVTTGPKIDIYHQQTAEVWQSLTRFQKGAYGGRFRRDGQLLIAGSEEAQLKLFNYKQKQLLRIFKGHSGPVHRADFVYGKSQVVGFSDDKTVSVFDIADEKRILVMDEHKDFIRAGVASSSSEHIVISGSYDHTVKVWDTRTGASVMTFEHGAPVQSVLCYPSGSVVAAAAGTEVRIFDLIGGKIMSMISQHHKTITCLSLATKNSRLMSGSLDRHVKVYDLNTYSTLHTMEYAAPVLSLAVAPSDSTIVTGLFSGKSGLVSFQQRSIKDTSEKKKSTVLKEANVRKIKLMPGDEIVTHMAKPDLARYDEQLSRFQFTKAFDSVLKWKIRSTKPHVTVSVLRELIRRGGLASALAGRDVKSLRPILRFLTRHIKNPHFHGVLIEVANTFLDIYGDSVQLISSMFGSLNRLKSEIEFDLAISRSGIGLMGAIEMFLVSSSVRAEAQDQGLAVKLNQSIGSAAKDEVQNSEVKESDEVVVDIC